MNEKIEILSYWKRIPEKDMTMEVIVNFSTKPGQVVDVNVYSLDYKIPKEELKIWNL